MNTHSLPLGGICDQTCWLAEACTVLLLLDMMWRLQAVSAQQKALVTNPIKSVMYQHAGPVHAVSASPFDPSLVLSCGLDGQVRVCSSLFGQPVVELAPSDSYLFAAQWSPTRPLLVAVGAGWLIAQHGNSIAQYENTIAEHRAVQHLHDQHSSPACMSCQQESTCLSSSWLHSLFVW